MAKESTIFKSSEAEKKAKSPIWNIMKVKDDPVKSQENPMLFEYDLEKISPESTNFDPVLAEEARRAKKDSLLFSNHLGDYCISSAYAFPKMYNSLPMDSEIRSKYFVVRANWLGSGGQGRFEEMNRMAKSKKGEARFDFLDKTISDFLVKDLVKMAASYYFDTDITDPNKKQNARLTGVPVQFRYYRNAFVQSFDESSYTYPLVLALADLFENPDTELPNIPESVPFGHYLVSRDEKLVRDEIRSPKWENCEIIRPSEIQACKDLILSRKFEVFGEIPENKLHLLEPKKGK